MWGDELMRQRILMIIKMLYRFLSLSKFLSEVKCLFKLWPSLTVQPHIYMVSAFTSYPGLLHQPPAQPCSVLMSCLTAHPPCPDVAGHSPSAAAAAFPLSMTPLLLYNSVLDVSRPAFPISAGFPSPNCMNRPHSREHSHAPWLGYSLPVCLGKDCWDWGPNAFLSYGAGSCSQCNILYLKVTSWEEPAALAGFVFSLSGWHKPYHYPCSSYFWDLEKTKFFSYHPVFMLCRLAGYEFFLWWSRWLTLSSHLFMISWHLVLSFVFMVRCFSSLWVIRIQIPFLKSAFIHLKTCLGKPFL